MFSAILLNRVIVNLERENFVQNEYKDLLGHPRLQFLVSTGYGSIPRTEEHEKVKKMARFFLLKKSKIKAEQFRHFIRKLRVFAAFVSSNE